MQAESGHVLQEQAVHSTPLLELILRLLVLQPVHSLIHCLLPSLVSRIQVWLPSTSTPSLMLDRMEAPRFATLAFLSSTCSHSLQVSRLAEHGHALQEQVVHLT